MGNLLEATRVSGVLPGENRIAGVLRLVQFLIEVNGLASGEEVFESTLVQSRPREFERVGVPCGLEIAKIINEALEFGRANLWDEVQPDPVA